MATEVKNIPILKGREAKKFVDKANLNEKQKRGTIDFSKQSATAKRILQKSLINK